MDRWDAGSEYDVFMGRWSHLVAEQFVARLDLPPGLRWLDVGCGTGALTRVIADRAVPSNLAGVDPSAEFVELASSRLGDDADLRVGDGEELPFPDGSFDVVVSGLSLNFIPDPAAALCEFQRVAVPGGVVSAYVWDYADGMEFLRCFWDAAIALDPHAGSLDEAVRFPLCQPDRLRELFTGAGLCRVITNRVEVQTVFDDFDDYWNPFLLGQGPAPSYVASLADPDKYALQHYLRQRLTGGHHGEIVLTGRAWTVAGNS